MTGTPLILWVLATYLCSQNDYREKITVVVHREKITVVVVAHDLREKITVVVLREKITIVVVTLTIPAMSKDM